MTLGEICQSAPKVTSACKRKDSFPCQNKNKAFRLHGVQMTFLPPKQQHSHISHICPSIRLVDFQKSSLEPFRVLIFCMWHEMAIQAVLVCWRKKEEQQLSRLSSLSPLPGPIIKKQMSCLAVPLQKDVMTACGPRARGGAATSHCPRDEWYWWRRNTHILPEYEQQICQCVTGCQPRSQLLVHCCYISTLSKYSAKRQSASSSRGRQVAS